VKHQNTTEGSVCGNGTQAGIAGTNKPSSVEPLHSDRWVRRMAVRAGGPDPDPRLARHVWQRQSKHSTWRRRNRRGEVTALRHPQARARRGGRGLLQRHRVRLHVGFAEGREPGHAPAAADAAGPPHAVRGEDSSVLTERHHARRHRASQRGPWQRHRQPSRRQRHGARRWNNALPPQSRSYRINLRKEKKKK